MNPKKFAPGKFDTAELTIQEFSRIFRTDSVSEKLIKQIKKELMEQDRKKELKQMRLEQRKLECLCEPHLQP